MRLELRSRYRQEFRHQKRVDGIKTAFVPVAGILDFAGRHLWQGETIVVHCRHARLDAGSQSLDRRRRRCESERRQTEWQTVRLGDRLL